MSSVTEISQRILKDSGWFPERKIDATFWIRLLQKADYPIFEALEYVLENFGGLKIVTSSFQEESFFIKQQEAILLHRSDPIIEFLPGKSKAIELSQAPLWKSLHYLKNKDLEIAPIGIFRHTYPRAYSLFVLSNGSIYGGGSYSTNESDNLPGLFYLGHDIENAINNTIEDFLAFW